MNLGGYDIGVCSWSIRPSSTAEMVDALAELGLSHLQISLAQLMDFPPEERAATLAAYEAAGVELLSGMLGFVDENYSTIASIRKTGGYVSPDLWPVRRGRALAAATLAAEIGLTAVTTHAGFVPPSADPAYRRIVDNLAELAAHFDRAGVDLLLETGQENAAELLQFLNDLNAPNVGVNFDAANMVLYGAGDPAEAIGFLGRHIRHVHIKDAVASLQPGIEWGREEPFGQGALDVHGLLRALHDADYDGPLVIEREAGPDRIADIRAAIDVLAAHYGE